MQAADVIDRTIWQNESCAPYRSMFDVPIEHGATKTITDPALLNDLAFWRCNASHDAWAIHEMNRAANEVRVSYGIFVVFFFALLFVLWYVLHKKRILAFQAHYLDRLSRESHRFDRDAVAQIRAHVEREWDESKRLFPYILGIRQQYKIPLASTVNTAWEVQQAVNTYLTPRAQVELDEKRMELALRKRGEEISQDLQAEVPRFVREQLRRQHQEEQSRWRATTHEVTEIRKTLIATVTELRENPALQTKLGMVVDALTNLSDTMNRLRNDGKIQDDSLGEYLDRIVTKVTEDHLAKSTGSVLNAD